MPAVDISSVSASCSWVQAQLARKTQTFKLSDARSAATGASQFSRTARLPSGAAVRCSVRLDNIVMLSALCRPRQERAQNLLKHERSTVSLKLSVSDSAVNPICLVLQALNLLERTVCQVSLNKLNGHNPSRIVERVYLDAVRVLPIAIALGLIPSLQLLKCVHVVKGPSGLTFAITRTHAVRSANEC
jgi:hypothetical protein